MEGGGAQYAGQLALDDFNFWRLALQVAVEPTQAIAIWGEHQAGPLDIACDGLEKEQAIECGTKQDRQ